MYETIGFLELNSIAKGVEAADAILKAAETDLLFARAGCPGKRRGTRSGTRIGSNADCNGGRYYKDHCPQGKTGSG